MRRRTLKFLFLLGAFFLLTEVSFAQLASITVSVSGGSVGWNNSFGNALTPGSATNPGSSSITISTSWSLLLLNNRLRLYAYFNSSTAALVHTVCTTGCTDIPSSAIQLQVNAGAFNPVTGTGPFGAAGASLILFDIPISALNLIGSRNDALTFNIDLSSLPQLPADTYNGTVMIQAQATP